jgi:hypothetical protein
MVGEGKRLISVRLLDGEERVLDPLDPYIINVLDGFP